MKKSLLSALALCFCLGISAKTTYLTFEVENATERSVNIVVKKPLTQNMNIYKVGLRPDNTVSTAIDLNDVSIADITYGGKAFRLYLRPGDDLNIQFSADAVLNSMKFGGKGAENNQLLADYGRDYKSSGYWTYDAAYLPTNILYSYYDRTSLDPSEYFAWVEKQRAEQHALADSRAADVDAALLDYVKKDIDYSAETHKIAFFIRNRNKMAPGDFQRVAQHYKLSPIATKQEDELLSHPTYVNFIHAYLHYLHLPNDPESPGVELAYYDLVENHITGRTRCYLMSTLLIKVYQSEGTTDLAKKKFSRFQTECPYPEYLDPIKELYADILIDMPEVEAPDFRVMDESGRVGRLSDYRGQVVYVSFWAHWCKPCIKNFKKSVSLRAQLKKMGVVLLNVSIDEEEQVWKDALILHDIYGTNTRAADLSEVMQQYGLGSLPAYFIINKKGKFAYLSDEANRDIMQEFRDLVNE